MSDEIQVFFDEPGSLDIECEAAEFAEIRYAVWKAARLEVFPESDLENIQEIRIAGYLNERSYSPSFAAYLFLFGCCAIGLALLFVFGVGVTTIVGWLRPG